MNGSLTNMIAFRNARKGYDKGDVHRYIEEMNIRFSSMEDKLKSENRRTEQDLDAVRRELADANARLEAMTALQSELDALKSEIETLKAENEALAQQLTEAEAAKAVASDGSEEAPLTYEETSRRLGDILLKANMDADRIVAEAEKEAASHLSGAEREADDIRLDATVTARLMTDRVKRRLTELTGEYIASLEAFSATSAEEYRKICEELKIKLGAANLDAAEILRDLKK
jgi:cell division septum initiation protein DivIVA